MKWWTAFCILAAAALPSDRSLAAESRFPDWPCGQAKVPEISLAAVWNGPPLGERTTRKQREAAQKVRNDTEALQALQDATPKDQAKIDELSNQLIWETRIFEDRRRVIKFVCEVPTAIDQRLFALGRVIQQEME
jgi:hypothetical protein